MLDVIVPVYGGLAATRRCIESVLASRARTPFELVVIDDASPEPEISAWLDTLAGAGRIVLLRNPVNEGFVRTVNRGMARHRDRDVLLLNSDTEVADGWLDRIVACAARDPRTGTVSPFSNNATICSFPDFHGGHPLPPGTTTASLDRLFGDTNAGRAVEIPTSVGFCMWIARRCLAAVGDFDEATFGRGYGEEVDFCMRAARAGFRHWLAGDVFVYHAGEGSFGGSGAERRAEAQRIIDERYPEFQPAVRDFVARDPPKPLRDAVLARLVTLQGAPGRPGEATTDAVTAGSGRALDETVPSAAPLVIVSGGDPAALEATVRTLIAQAVIPGLHVCVVEDATPEGRAALERIGASLAPPASWSVQPPAIGGDFRATLEAAIGAHGRRDVALVAAGASLPFAWDARLAKAAHAQPAIAAAVPMCDVSPLFALVDEKRRAGASLDAPAVDRVAYALGDRAYYEVPALHATCAYLRRDALDAALPHVEAGAADPQALLDALARRFRVTGRIAVVCDYVYAGYAGPALVPRPSLVDAQALLRDHPLSGLRRAMDDAIARGLPPASVPGLDHRPVVLHVMHFWGGGIERWVRDFGRGDPSRTHLILATFRIGETGGQRIVLYGDPSARVPIRTWDITRAIPSSATTSLEYRRVLDEVVQQFGVEAIVVSSLIGHALDALSQPVRTLVVCHDFYPVCQAINPSFDGPCSRCTPDDLRRCKASNPLNRFFDDLTTDEWHELRELYASRLLAGGIDVVVPSPSVAATLVQLSPRLASLPMRVVPHGIDLDAPRLAPAPRGAGEPLRIVVPGLMSARKGADLLRAAAAGLRDIARITLVGGGEGGVELARECGWACIERYEPEALPGLLREIAPHAGLLASIVPESFSYTLSELRALGIPPLATAMGSFRDRIVDGENGFLFEPDARALIALVLRLHGEPELLASVAQRLAAAPRPRTVAEMVADYDPLLPQGERAVARFAVGAGRQTGLTEPYRHLTTAYGDLTEAYAKLMQAYTARTEALEQATADRERAEAVRASAVELVREYRALDVRRHPWRLGRLDKLVAAFDAGLASPSSPSAHGQDDDAT